MKAAITYSIIFFFGMMLGIMIWDNPVTGFYIGLAATIFALFVEVCLTDVPDDWDGEL